MDIHKPKAAHSLREFAIEIGTIICGILIALGLEQAVEWRQRQAEVSETRAALREEISVNLRDAQYSLAEDECVGGQIDGWMAWARGGPKPTYHNGVFPPFPSVAWDVAKSGASAHMPLPERLALTRFYSTLEILDRLKTVQVDSIATFAGYLVFDRLEPEQTQQVLVALSRAKGWATYKRTYAAQVLAQGKALGIAPQSVDAAMRASLEAVCRDVGMKVPALGETS